MQADTAPSSYPEDEQRDTASPDVRRIAASNPTVVDPFARLQAMWIYKFYKRHLQHYGWVRQGVRLLWGVGHRLYQNQLARFLSRVWRAIPWQPVVQYGSYVNQENIETYVLAPGVTVDTPAPRVLPEKDQNYLVAPHTSYVFPDVTVAVIGPAMICGGTNMVFVDGSVLCHDLYDWERDYTSEELGGRMLMDVRNRRAKVRWHEVSSSHLAQAASFIDACAPNYAHWMTEVLPRIALFCADERFGKIPLAVNADLHPNIVASLFQVAGSQREIIAVGTGCALKVERLYVTSPAGYVPFERRKSGPAEGHSHGLFSPHAFAAVRRAVLGGCDLGERAPSRKIYLRRNSGVRKVTNAQDIERALTRLGFEVVEPEKLTFQEQAAIFSQAAVIVGSSGAALGNIVFTHPAARLYIMISKQPNTSYWYWQNMARAAGGQVIYILGEPESAGGIHADFRVDLDEMLASVGETR